MSDLYHQFGGANGIRGRRLQFNQRSDGTPLRVLSETDWQFWQENGYVIVPDAVPAENLEAVTDLLWEFQEMDRRDPATWYRNPARFMEMVELRGSGMVEVYNHQALWNNRQHPRVYGAFVDIWGREDLWVTIDRANLNVPSRAGHEFLGFIHWDVDTSLDPLPVNVQGVLSLCDATIEMGGFQCVPLLYRNFREWVKTQPPGSQPVSAGYNGLRDRQGRNQGRGPADLEQPAGARYPRESFRQTASGAIHRDDAGGGRESGTTPVAHPILARPGCAGRLCFPRRPAQLGADTLRKGAPDRAG